MDLPGLLAPSLALGARWSVSIHRDGDGPPLAEHDAANLLRTASVAKVFVLVEVARRIASGELDAGLPVGRGATPPVHDSGIWQALRTDVLPVADLAVLVGAVSDNWATNALLELCGLDRVQVVARELAPGGSTLHDLVRDERGPGTPATLSTGCAADWVAILQHLLRDGGTAGAQVLAWLAHGADLSMVAGAFDLDPLAHGAEDLGLRLWHKTGTDAGVRADVGVVRSATSAISYAAICNWPADDDRPATRRAVLAAMRGMGEAIRTSVLPDEQGNASL